MSIRLPASWMRAALAPALIFMATASDQGWLADYWHHLARGRAMAEQGRLVDTDLFTFTVPGKPFEDVNWLPQLLYVALDTHGGMPLVRFVNALALAAMMGLLVHLCWRQSGSVGVAAVVGVFAFFGLWQALTVRPQTFAMLFFVLLYEALDRSERRTWWLLAAPPLLALWVNVHGSFPAGLLLIGSFLAAAAWEAWPARRWAVPRDRRVFALALCLLASVLATLVNPYGWRAYHFVANTSTVAGGRPIEEWLPPSPDLLIGKFWVVSLALVLLGFGLSRRRPTAREVCVALCFLPLACASVRMVVWWLLAVTPVLAAHLAANLPRREAAAERPSFASAAFFGLIVLLAALSVPGLDRYNPLLGPARPSAGHTERELGRVAEWVAGRNAGRIFCRFEWGAFLNCSLGTRYPVFMDGRIDIFPDEVWEQYSALTTGRADWEEILDRYRVDYLLLDARYHGGTGLLPQVERSGRWESAFQAGDALVFVRRSAGDRLSRR
jgi:hypothetical protein